MERELRELPKLTPGAVPAKVAAIRQKLLSELEAQKSSSGGKILELKKTAELLENECGEEVARETRESIQRLEREVVEKAARHSKQLKAVISQIEKLMQEDKWSILAEVLDVVKKLTP